MEETRPKKKRKVTFKDLEEEEEEEESKEEKEKREKKEKKEKEEKEEEEREKENGSLLQRSHPLGVRPLGNWLFFGGLNQRDTGLGILSSLSDELITEILRYLSGKELSICSQVSVSLYVFSTQDDLWKETLLSEFGGDFEFLDTWKQTYYKRKWDQEISNSPFQCSSFFSDHLYQSWYCGNLEIPSSWIKQETIPRRENLSLSDFISEYREPNQPVIITDIATKWRAFKEWDNDYLQRLCHGNKLTADYDAYNTKCSASVNFTYKNYKLYAKKNRDELPLYIFDSDFCEKFPKLRDDYHIPEYFSEDLFSVLEKKRPPYRWLLLGPCRSGSSFHVDPNSTSAWNAVLQGHKKWILFPPGVTPPGIHKSENGVVTPVSVMEWFKNYYRAARTHSPPPLECVLNPGEIIFVPRGWWHLVLNLDFTVSVTQNFVDSENVAFVLRFLEQRVDDIVGFSDRSSMYNQFVEGLQKQHPEVLAKGLQQEEERKKRHQESWEEKVNKSDTTEFSLLSFF